MTLPERKAPTHVLRISIPLNLPEDRETTDDFDAVADSVQIALSASRAAYRQRICDDIDVTIETC